MANRILYYFSIDFEKNIEDIFNHQMMQIEQEQFEREKEQTNQTDWVTLYHEKRIGE